MENKKHLLDLLNKVTQDEPVKTQSASKYSRVLLVDGLNLFFRNFAVLNFTNDNGTHIGGLGGFLRSLGYLIDTISPTSVYVVFDGVGSTTNRKNLLPEYKSNRNIQRITNWDGFDSLDDENDARIDQISRLIHYLHCLPVKTISIDKVEADDIISHLSAKFSTEYNSKVFVVSSDKDFVQLISPTVNFFSPTEKIFYTPEKVIEKFGVHPDNFILYKTLLGDSSDVVKGVKGLGPKKLFKLFPELKEKILSLEEIFKICEEKYKEHVIYSQILLNEDSIRNNYKVMDLRNPLIDDNGKEIINSLIETPVPSLRIDVFMHMFNEDGMIRIINNVEYWLRKNFITLNNIK